MITQAWCGTFLYVEKNIHCGTPLIPYRGFWTCRILAINYFTCVDQTGGVNMNYSTTYQKQSEESKKKKKISILTLGSYKDECINIQFIQLLQNSFSFALFRIISRFMPRPRGHTVAMVTAAVFYRKIYFLFSFNHSSFYAYCYSVTLPYRKMIAHAASRNKIYMALCISI